MNANPAYLVSVTPANTGALCAGSIQSLAATSPNAYSNYTWTPVTNLYTDAAATIPYTTGTNAATVYVKPAGVASVTYTVSTAGSGCTNTAVTNVTSISAPVATVTASPTSVCPGANVQLAANVAIASAYCTATGGTGTYYINDFSTTGGATNITNNSSGFSTGGYGYFSSMNVTQAVGSSVSWSASNFAPGTYGVSIYVDWNQNGVLTDAGEQMYTSGTYVSSATGSFAVPAGALNGSTRMRVVVDYLNTAPGACDVATSHETEDYNFIVTGGVAPPVYTYDWSSNSTYLSATTIANPVAQNMISTQVYSVVVTSTSGGCSSTINQTVIVNPLPVPLASSNSPICAGASLSLFGSNQDPLQPSNNYLWTGPGGYNNVVQNPLINGTTVANSGYYVVAVTNSFGCSKSDSTLVDIVPPPALSILSQTNVSCNGGNDGAYIIVVTNDPNPGSTFYNFDGVVDTAGFYTGVIAGTYTVQVTDGIGCLNSIQVVITEPDLLTVAAGSNTPVCTGTSLNLTATPAGEQHLLPTPGQALTALPVRYKILRLVA
ncbi:MAG: hypothetical protein IPP71_08440 [Bacteroidetes bacterium]|nr:hypothetical protein [Bacteroidota bacterium]